MLMVVDALKGTTLQLRMVEGINSMHILPQYFLTEGKDLRH
jgi:hypothetical protein